MPAPVLCLLRRPSKMRKPLLWDDGVEISSVVHQPGGEPPKKFNGLRERESKIPRRRHFHNLPDFPRRLRRIAGRIFFRSIRGKNGNTTAKAASPGACSLCATTVLTIPQTGKTAALPETISWPVRIFDQRRGFSRATCPGRRGRKGASGRRIAAQGKAELAALANFAFDPYILAHPLKQLFGDGEPQAAAMPLCALSTL